MHRFPFLYFEKLYHSPVSQAEVLHRVQGTVLEPLSRWQAIWSQRPKEPYYGRVDAYNGVFDITGSINRRNDLFPAVEGFTEACPPAGGGSFVRLRMTLPERTKYFAFVWFSFIGAFCVACIVALLLGSATWGALVPLGMFGAAQLSFWLEVWSIERRYSDLLELVEISETP
ncbi:MAG TPA: hypothetical protein VF629_16025 [Hymenobacter sp.]|jgi:hypothetical protein|uniref:hypothetical protein n=1 Tax=Hymenobacter sp. TaxID=1898978 RepID=UPI002ED90EA8